MSDRETALALLENVPEHKLGYVIAFLQGLIVGEIAERHEKTTQHDGD